MELHQLKYFVAVAQIGNFSRAAERCHVSQPSLSQQITKLERRLKRRLFDRLGRRVVLTDAGRLLLERATAVLSAVEDAERQMRDAEDAEGGRLAIGAIPTIAPYLLPAALKRFAGRYPRVELAIQEQVTGQLIASTAAGELDLAILALPIEDERLVVEPIATEPLYLALPPGHRLSRRRQIAVTDLADERFILLDEMHCLGEQILSFCRAGGCLPRIACRSAQLATILALIELGQGISLIPEMARHGDMGKKKTYRALSPTSPTRTIAAIWHRRRYRSPMAERFLKMLKAFTSTGRSPAP